MEGKTVILSVLIMSLVMAQNQVEAEKSCCPTTRARYIFDYCTSHGVPLQFCIPHSGCKVFLGNSCPPTFPDNHPENSADAVNEYCKLGCTSSVCGPSTTLPNFGASEAGDGAVEDCAKACSAVCTKGSKLAVETA